VSGKPGQSLMFGLPTAAFGALLTLMLFHIDLNLYAMVGVIMLRTRS